MERAFRGIWIPADVWLNKDLSIMEKVMLAVVDVMSEGEGCYASNTYLADVFNVSENRISHILTDLKRKNLLYQVSFDGRTRILKTERKYT